MLNHRLAVRCESFEPGIWAIGTAVLRWLLNVLRDRASERRWLGQNRQLDMERLHQRLWKKLLAARRGVNDLCIDIDTGRAVLMADDQVRAAFNDLQAAVRETEPFLDSAVFAPANEIEELCREVIENVGKLRHLDRLEHRSNESWGRCDDERLRLNDENDTSLQRIDELLDMVKRAIRSRAAA